MPLFGSGVVPFKGQDYSKLKSDCKAKGSMFYDPEFPPEDKSLFYSSGKLTGVVWKRPKQICDSPKLFVEGASAGDVTQGRLGNCWFVAASSCLALYKELWNRAVDKSMTCWEEVRHSHLHESPNPMGQLGVVLTQHHWVEVFLEEVNSQAEELFESTVIPRDQEWDDNKPDDYCGIFHFRFWRYGEWVDVVIDDQLPTINDELVFIHSQSKNEFWSALLEKAYAKLFGCYEALDGGDLGEALEDFTGGVSEQIDIAELGLVDKPEERTTFFARLQKEVDRRSLLAASIPAKSSDEMEAATEMGLVKGHAYGITAVKNIALEGSSGLFSFWNKNKMPMVRLRNPWGQGEWKGAFSDNDPEWNKIPKTEREKMGIVFEEDGEFWMTFEDFCQHFINVSYCRVVNTSIFSLSKTWHEGIGHSAWKSPGLCGGCMNNKETFLKNPQFVFSVTEDEDEAMIQLMQKSTRGREGSDNTTIGFTIMRVELNRQYRIHDFAYQEVVSNSVFRDSRAIFQKVKLTKGRYAVICCTFDQNVEREFIFRIYTSAANDFKEMKREKPERSFWNCCAKKPVMITQVKVIKAEGLEKQERDGADPYCIISCEREKVRTHTRQDTVNPEFGQTAIFYRKNPVKNPVKIQIWNSNVIKDSYMGKHIFMSADECNRRVESVSLVGRGKDTVQKPGKLIVEITQSRNMMFI